MVILLCKSNKPMLNLGPSKSNLCEIMENPTMHVTMPLGKLPASTDTGPQSAVVGNLVTKIRQFGLNKVHQVLAPAFLRKHLSEG